MRKAASCCQPRALSCVPRAARIGVETLIRDNLSTLVWHSTATPVGRGPRPRFRSNLRQRAASDQIDGGLDLRLQYAVVVEGRHLFADRGMGFRGQFPRPQRRKQVDTLRRAQGLEGEDGL